MRKYRALFVIAGLLVVLTIAACGGTAATEEGQETTPGVVNQQEEVLDAGNEEESGEPTAQEAVVPGQGESASQGVYGDLPAGFTEEGFPYRGDPGAPDRAGGVQRLPVPLLRAALHRDPADPG